MFEPDAARRPGSDSYQAGLSAAISTKRAADSLQRVEAQLAIPVLPKETEQKLDRIGIALAMIGIQLTVLVVIALLILIEVSK